jgi:hypothetical protein
MPYPPPEKASPDEIGNILAKLEVLLTDLPSQLPRGDDFDFGRRARHLAMSLGIIFQLLTVNKILTLLIT